MFKTENIPKRNIILKDENYKHNYYKRKNIKFTKYTNLNKLINFINGSN